MTLLGDLEDVGSNHNRRNHLETDEKQMKREEAGIDEATVAGKANCEKTAGAAVVVATVAKFVEWKRGRGGTEG